MIASWLFPKDCYDDDDEPSCRPYTYSSHKRHLLSLTVIYHPTNEEAVIAVNVAQPQPLLVVQKEASAALSRTVNHLFYLPREGPRREKGHFARLTGDVLFSVNPPTEIHVSTNQDLEQETKPYQFGDYTKGFTKGLFRFAKRNVMGEDEPQQQVNKKPEAQEPPGPPARPIAGNIPDILPDIWTAAHNLIPEYGKVIKLSLLGAPFYIVADPKVFESVLVLKDKLVPPGSLAGKGVFLSDGEPWKFARDTLTRCFTPTEISKYVPHWQKKATEMVAVFAGEGENPLVSDKLNADEGVDVWEWTSRLMYDTICELGFSYQPNMLTSKEEQDRLVEAFDYCMEESLARVMRFPPLNILHKKKYDAEYAKLHSILDNLIDNHANSPFAELSVLGSLLNARHSRTGEPFTREQIRDQCITLLVAGHKTTQILMSWALYLISHEGDVEEEMYAEIMREIDVEKPITMQMLNKLKFMDQVLLETLRLYAPAQSVSRGVVEGMTVEDMDGNSWYFEAGSHVFLAVYEMHRHTDLWDKPEKFDPHRWDGKAFAPKKEGGKGYHPFQFTPFGGGARLCIGNLFALTQVKLYMSLLIQRFYLRPSKTKIPQIGQDFVVPTEGIGIRFIVRSSWGKPQPPPAVDVSPPQRQQTTPANEVPANIGKGTAVEIYVGSENGVTSDGANKLAKFLDAHDFNCTVSDLNNLQKDGTLNNTAKNVIVMSSSYNGQPPKNAATWWKEFVLPAIRDKKTPGEAVAGSPKSRDAHTIFCVAGFGHHNWHLTYQKVAKESCKVLQQLPDWTEMADFQPFDVGQYDWENDFEQWKHVVLLRLAQSCNPSFLTQPSNEPTRELSIGQHESMGVNIVWRDMSQPVPDGVLSVEQSKRGFFKFKEYVEMEFKVREPLVNYEDRRTEHIQIVPVNTEDASKFMHTTGDHVAIWPVTSAELVTQLAQRLKLDLTSEFSVEISAKRLVSWVENTLCDVATALSTYFDITTPPTRAALNEYADFTTNEDEKASMKRLARADYQKKVQSERLTVLDILNQHPSCNPPFNLFCELTPQQSPRYYSISSRGGAPVELTVGCLQYNLQDKAHFGLCSNYLSGTKKSATSPMPNAPSNEGSIKVWAALQQSSFRLPEDDQRPIIMVCNGTGLAPFRAFIQDRAQKKKEGKVVGGCTLYFGCRNKKELLHGEELEQYEKDGVAELNVAYSREPGVPKTYVYTLLSQQKEKVAKLLNNENAVFYVCGAANTMAKDVMITLANVLQPGVRHTDETAMEVMDTLTTKGQAFLDVWG